MLSMPGAHDRLLVEPSHGRSHRFGPASSEVAVAGSLRIESAQTSPTCNISLLNKPVHCACTDAACVLSRRGRLREEGAFANIALMNLCFNHSLRRATMVL